MIEHLRELLLGPHEQPQFAMIWEYFKELLDTKPDPDEYQAALNYVNAHLEEWPDATREMNIGDGCAQPYWSLLREFNMGHKAIFKKLNSPYLSNLHRLFCMGHILGPEHAEAIVRFQHAGHLSSLRHLYLGNNNIRDRGVKAISSSPYMENIESLSLWVNEIGPLGAHAIAESKHLKNMTLLNLSSNSIDDEGFRALINSPNIGTVKNFGMYNNLLTDESVIALLDACHQGHLDSLETLNIANGRDGQITARGDAMLRCEPLFKGIKIRAGDGHGTSRY